MIVETGWGIRQIWQFFKVNISCSLALELKDQSDILQAHLSVLLCFFSF